MALKNNILSFWKQVKLKSSDMFTLFRVGVGVKVPKNKLHVKDSSTPLRVEGLTNTSTIYTPAVDYYAIITDPNGVFYRQPAGAPISTGKIYDADGNQFLNGSSGNTGVTGNLSVAGTLTFGGSSSALITVPNGGTGATTFTSNAILTGNGTSAIQSESTLTYSGEILTIGNEDNGAAAIKRTQRSGSNLAGGSLQFQTGFGTGSGGGGDFLFLSSGTNATATSLGALQVSATLTSGGNLTLLGDLTISGGNITNAITFDSGITNAGTIAAGTWNGTAIAQSKIADQAINEAKLQVSNDPTNGYMLTAQSGNTGGLTWAAAPTDTNTQNTTTLSFVDSSNDILLRNTTGGASSGTDDIKFVAGSNVTLTHTDADNITIASTDTNTTYSVQDGELSQNNFTNADHTKLNGIEDSATADQTQADINGLGITAVGISGPTDGDVLISTDGSISVILDNDDNESNQYFEVRNSATGVVFLVNENGNVDVGGTVDGRDVAADGTKLDGIESGATADQTNVTGSSGSCTGNAATATALTSGDKTIEGNLRLGGTGDTSNNWLSIDAQNGDDSSGGGITFYETGTYDVDSPQYGAKIVYNEDADEFAIGTMHNNVFMRQIYFSRQFARTYFNGDLQIRDSSPSITVVDTSTTVANGDVVGTISFNNEDDDGTTLRLQAVATEDHASGANGGTKLEIKTTPNGSSTEAVALTVGEDKSLTVGGAIELGHATDTTLARSAAGIATIEGKQIFTTNTPALTSAAAGVPAVTMQIRRTITTAEANALNSTPIELIPAQGANTVIVLAGGMIRIDRAATQTNSAADMNLHYEGLEPGTFAQTALFHARRFMYNETGDRVFNIIPGMSAYEVAQSLTQDVNKAVEVSVDSALTSDCITSMEFYLTYNVFNIS